MRRKRPKRIDAIGAIARRLRVTHSVERSPRSPSISLRDDLVKLTGVINKPERREPLTDDELIAYLQLIYSGDPGVAELNILETLREKSAELLTANAKNAVGLPWVNSFRDNCQSFGERIVIEILDRYDK